ncbi:hypothetical protein C8R44DRAFT_981760, partial [Mycena epipterygia]
MCSSLLARRRPSASLLLKRRAVRRRRYRFPPARTRVMRWVGAFRICVHIWSSAESLKNVLPVIRPALAPGVGRVRVLTATNVMREGRREPLFSPHDEGPTSLAKRAPLLLQRQARVRAQSCTYSDSGIGWKAGIGDGDGYRDALATRARVRLILDAPRL